MTAILTRNMFFVSYFEICQRNVQGSTGRHIRGKGVFAACCSTSSTKTIVSPLMNSSIKAQWYTTVRRARGPEVVVFIVVGGQAAGSQAELVGGKSPVFTQRGQRHLDGPGNIMKLSRHMPNTKKLLCVRMCHSAMAGTHVRSFHLHGASNK